MASGFAASFAYAINGSGQVAGHVISATGNSEKIFRYTNGTMVVLGGFGEAVVDGGEQVPGRFAQPSRG